MAQPTDAELVDKAGRGDLYAFAALVKRYCPLVHSLALSWTGRHEAADDMVQETFCRAFTSLGTLRRPEQFRFWLWSIARRSCQTWRRDRARHRETDEVSANAPAADDPARDAELDERHRRVRQAVDELPEKYRIVVQLRHLQGMSYEEIAALLELSVSGVSNRLAEARERLRVKLQPLVAE
jgi:RNA polymerase sigma-70 factor (ECF subfamily)